MTSFTSFLVAPAFALACAVSAAAAPRVAVDIPPIHSLVARVMVGVGAPALITPPGATPHGRAMKPSEAAALDGADLVFWVGEALSPGLGRLIGNLSPGVVVKLMEAQGVTLLPYREGAGFAAHGASRHDDGHGHDHDHDHGHGDGRNDPHIWLDPVNGEAILAAAAAALSKTDPENAALYAANAAAGKQELEALRGDIDAALAPVRGRSFVVLHDAFHYFEARFAFEAAGALSPPDASAPGPAWVQEFRDLIGARGVVCAFIEPQMNPKLLMAAVEGTPARVGVLDPLGVDLAPGPELYPALLGNLARSLADCLAE
ncbi:zinc ABC transporter substrate-binding protein [Pikeienuella sp. HZG-20]|uniref:zinc ABC transporter substrate-binding protein n=1 Tax=Paludibacillus litoralis TaxID=3133267 RepID=UPI0030ECD2A1